MHSIFLLNYLNLAFIRSNALLTTTRPLVMTSSWGVNGRLTILYLIFY